MPMVCNLSGRPRPCLPRSLQVQALVPKGLWIGKVGFVVGRMGPGVEGGGEVLERGLGWDGGLRKVVLLAYGNRFRDWGCWVGSAG